MVVSPSLSEQHAVVIGGSMAGLLAARVLLNHFGRVMVLERDRIPDQPSLRYLDLVVQASLGRSHIYRTFWEVLHMVKSPKVLFHPQILFPALGLG